jgi:hypothetical protein
VKVRFLARAIVISPVGSALRTAVGANSIKRFHWPDRPPT